MVLSARPGPSPGLERLHHHNKTCGALWPSLAPLPDARGPKDLSPVPRNRRQWRRGEDPGGRGKARQGQNQTPRRAGRRSLRTEPRAEGGEGSEGPSWRQSRGSTRPHSAGRCGTKPDPCRGLRGCSGSDSRHQGVERLGSAVTALPGRSGGSGVRGRGRGLRWPRRRKKESRPRRTPEPGDQQPAPPPRRLTPPQPPGARDYTYRRPGSGCG